MKMEFGRIGKVSDEWDYVRTRFDDGVKYAVWYGGKAPLNGIAQGIYVGDVARNADLPGEWLAAPPNPAPARERQWIGGFKSRHEASIYLFGRVVERNNL